MPYSETDQVINLRLFDIDGCLFHQYDNKKHILDWLIPTNQILLDSIIDDVATNHYAKVIVASGSNRQDYVIDWSNSWSGSFCPALPILQSYLQSHLRTQVVLDPILMADLYKNKPAGNSYKAILKTQLCDYKQESTRFKLNIDELAYFYQDLPEAPRDYKVRMAQFHNALLGGEALLAHDRACLDRNKVSLIYAHAHRVAMLHPSVKNIIIDFYDDIPEILSTIYDFYKNYSDFLPQQVTLRLHHYPLGQLMLEPLIGQGKVDVYYTWFMRTVANLTRCKNPAKEFQSAADLQNYHDNCDYAIPMGFSEDLYMRLTDKTVDINYLREFRENEIPKLGFTDIDLSQQNAYTTAWRLHREGLIPGELVLTHDCKSGLIAIGDIEYIQPIKLNLRNLFNSYIYHLKSYLTFFFPRNTQKAEEILYTLLQCRDIEDMINVLKLSRESTDVRDLTILIERAKSVISEFERTLHHSENQVLEPAYEHVTTEDTAIPSSSTARTLSFLRDSITPAKARYSYQVLIFLREGSGWGFTQEEGDWHNAFKRKWETHHAGKSTKYMDIAPISPADEIKNETKYTQLAQLDNRSRVTIVGNHKKGSEYFTYKEASVHYTKIIDLICQYVTSEKVLFNMEDVRNGEQALRINFISCTIYEPERDDSLAEKMFLYAANHPEKPIRIEMSAPQMYCAPFLGQPDRPRTQASMSLYSRYRWLPIYDFHKQYGERSSTEGLHKPPQRKVLLKVDATTSTTDRIVPEIIVDEAQAHEIRLC